MKRTKQMHIELVLPNTNTVDGRISIFLRQLDTVLMGKLFIDAIVPEIVDSKRILKFSCDIDVESFEKFQDVYAETFGRNFSFIWDSDK